MDTPQDKLVENCVKSQHTGQTSEDIQDKAKQVKEEMRSKIALERLQEKLQEVLTVKQKIKDEKEFLEEQRERVEYDLNVRLDTITELFENLIQENNELFAKAQEEIDRQISSICAVEGEIKRFIQDVTSSIAQGDKTNLALETLGKQEQQLNTICETPVESSKTRVISYQPSVELDKIIKEENVGEIKIGQEFEVVRVISKKGMSVDEIGAPVGLSVDDNGNIAVTDFADDEDVERVRIINSNGELITGPFGMDLLKWPVGIVHVPDSEHIIVADLETSALEMFNANTGEHLKTVWGKGSDDGQVLHPVGLSLDGDGNIIVCDRGNQRIQVMSPHGEFIRELVSKQADIFPRYCVCHKGNYYVTTLGETSVMVFNKNGEHLAEFLDKDGNAHKLDQPTGLAVDKDGHVIVCEWGGNRIHVYHNGVLLKTVGSYGNRPGQFIEPNDVKILPDGLIVVSDTTNHRLQILNLC